jgi:hypothetical protein
MLATAYEGGATEEVLYVNSAASNASDPSLAMGDGVHGYSWDYPLATIGKAITIINARAAERTASPLAIRYRIIVAKDHDETLAGDVTTGGTITANVAYIAIIGESASADLDSYEAILGGMPRIRLTENQTAIETRAWYTYIRRIAFEAEQGDNVGEDNTATGIKLTDGGAGSVGRELHVDRCRFRHSETNSGFQDCIVENCSGGSASRVHISRCFFCASSSNTKRAFKATTAGVAYLTVLNSSFFSYIGSADGILSGEIGTVSIVSNNVVSRQSGPFINFNDGTIGDIVQNAIHVEGASTVDSTISAAGCAKYMNLVTIGATPTVQAASPSTPSVGTLFVVEKSLTHSDIVSGGVDVTGTSSGGDILIEDVIIANGSTAMSSAGGAAVLELYTNNTNGSNTFLSEPESGLIANGTMDLDNATLEGVRTVLESGKKVTAKATGEDFTSGGAVKIYLICSRMTGGATLAAAA